MLQTPVSAAGSLSAERRGRQSSGPPVARAGFGDLAVLITSQPSLETKYFFPWIRCTIKEIMKIYALLGILMRVERRTTFGIMWVIFDHLRPSGHIMPDMQGDRGTVP